MGEDVFARHVALLRRCLAHREETAERIEAVLSSQRAPSRYMQGRALLTRQFEDCFLGDAARGELEQAHWDAGFKPREVQYLFNDLIDPVELMLRGLHCWQQTRWPGRSDRVHYAHTLFNLEIGRAHV